MKHTESKQKVQFFYELHRTPPSLLGETPDGTRYRMMLDGSTYFLLGGKIQVPAPGCMWPEKLFAANLAAFVFRNTRPIIVTGFILAALIVLQFFLWQLPGDNLDEMKLNFVSMVSFWVNTVLFIGTLLIVIACIAWNFGKGWKLKGEDETMELTSGMITIAPDTLVMSESESENPADMADRILAARAGQQEGEWVVVLPFRKDEILVVLNNNPDVSEFEGMDFTRAEWGEADMAANRPDYKKETWAEYIAYCQKFAQDFREWSAFKKPEYIDPVQALVARLRAQSKHMANVVLLLLCCLPVFAQKSAQVSAYLGEFRYENEKPQGSVKFVFEKGNINRDGDGSKSYKELLPNSSSYTDSNNAGKLIEIRVVGKLVDRETKTNVKPRFISQPTSEIRPISDYIPDSLETERSLDQKRVEIDRWKDGMWKQMRPYWKFIMWLFTGLILPVCLGVGGILRYIAKTAAGESAVNLHGIPVIGRFMVSAHQYASGALMGIAWVVTGVVLVNSFLWLYWWNFSFWFVVFVWAIELWLAEKLTNWIVPNMRIVSPGDRVNRFPQIGG